MVGPACGDAGLAIERWPKHSRYSQLATFAGIAAPQGHAVHILAPNRIGLRACATRPFEKPGPKGFCAAYDLELEYARGKWRVSSAALDRRSAWQRDRDPLPAPGSDLAFVAEQLAPFYDSGTGVAMAQAVRRGEYLYVVVRRVDAPSDPRPTALLAAWQPVASDGAEAGDAP